MISRLRVQNFKALRDVDVSLGRFNVLIGPNDTGKSSFLEAAYAFANTTQRPAAECFWSPWEYRELVHAPSDKNEVNIAAELAARPGDQQPLSYQMTLRFIPGHCRVVRERVNQAELNAPVEVASERNETFVCAYNRGDKHAHSETAVILSGLLHPAILARWDIEELGRASHLPADRQYPFDATGYGLSTRLAELNLYSREAFDALRDEFCKLFPDFVDIAIRRTKAPGFHRDARFRRIPSGISDSYDMVLRRKDGAEVPAALASGGTLVSLAFLTLAHLGTPTGLFVVEEPENGLHPQKLKEVVDVLRKLAETRIDRQVIVSTHSPLLLDYVDASEVRVFLRNDQDIDVYDLAHVPDIQERLKYMMLGELVYNEGEQQLVKEIRDHARAGSGGGGE